MYGGVVVERSPCDKSGNQLLGPDGPPVFGELEWAVSALRVPRSLAFPPKPDRSM